MGLEMEYHVQVTTTAGSTMVGTWGSVQADWTFLFVLLIGWYILIKQRERNGTLDR